MEIKRGIFEEIERLSLPPDQFMVLGSGIMAARGIREIGDIDLLVKEELFEELKNNGWKYEVIEIGGKPREKISKDGVEAFKDFWWDGGSLEPESGIAMAEKIKGINFIPLRVLLEVKKSMNREKDIQDVILIEKYLEKTSAREGSE